MIRILIVCFAALLFVFIIGFSVSKIHPANSVQNTVKKTQELPFATYPLAITAMQKKIYPGSDVVTEETLSPGSNYTQSIVSYKSDGLKIFALLTVPEGPVPKGGWPVIVFNHGYIPPEIYRTTERYIAYVDAFARNGYVVIKPDYRGNGLSEGNPEGAYYSPAYTTDVMNALASVKKLTDPVNHKSLIVNPNRIGMWGHSMGGNITLRSLELTNDVKAAVIWGGVVGSYNDLMHNWQRRVPFQPSPRQLSLRNNGRAQMIKLYGDPKDNGPFWQAIDPTQHLSLIKAPVQLDAGSEDEEVPVAFSKSLYDKLIALKKPVEFYTYEGSDHNISQGFDLAMQRSVEFFDKYLK